LLTWADRNEWLAVSSTAVSLGQWLRRKGPEGRRLSEIITWAQLGIHAKPVGLLNVAGFFDPLLAWVDRAVAEGFVKQKHQELLMVGDDPGELLDALARHRPPQTSKGIGRDDR
jgi:hypothetical protein